MLCLISTFPQRGAKQQGVKQQGVKPYIIYTVNLDTLGPLKLVLNMEVSEVRQYTKVLKISVHNIEVSFLWGSFI